jgi:hypothetical protein
MDFKLFKAVDYGLNKTRSLAKKISGILRDKEWDWSRFRLSIKKAVGLIFCHSCFKRKSCEGNNSTGTVLPTKSLKGLSHDIGDACRYFHCLNTRFNVPVSRIRFLKNILRLFSYRSPSGCVFTLYLSQEQDLPESNLITADHVGRKWFSRLENVHLCRKRTTPEQSSPVEMVLRTATPPEF